MTDSSALTVQQQCLTLTSAVPHIGLSLFVTLTDTDEFTQAYVISLERTVCKMRCLEAHKLTFTFTALQVLLLVF